MARNSPQSLFTQAVIAIALLSLSANAFAYLDPSTGSMVLSVIVGIFASIALALKTYWYKLRNLFRRAGKEAARAGKDSDPEK